MSPPRRQFPRVVSAQMTTRTSDRALTRARRLHIPLAMHKLLGLACLLVPTLASAENYSAYAWYDSVTVAPKKIVINAYQAEDTAVVLPAKATAYISFMQDNELNSGNSLQVRFGLGFDPDTTTLAFLGNAIPTQNAPVSANNGFVEMTVQAPIAIPAAMLKFRSWCTQPNTSYGIDGQIWAQLPSVLSSSTGHPLYASSPVYVQVNCLDKKSVVKIDTSKLPARLISPKLNVKVIPHH